MVAAALDRLANRTITFPTHAAAGVLGSVWSAVWERRRRERWEEDYWGRRADTDALELVEAERQDTPATRVVAANRRSGATRRCAGAGARLVILHWVHGYSNNEIAELDGLRPCTIRKHRRDAEHAPRRVRRVSAASSRAPRRWSCGPRAGVDAPSAALVVLTTAPTRDGSSPVLRPDP